MPTTTYRFKRRPHAMIQFGVVAAMIGILQILILASQVLRTDAPWMDALAESPALTVSSLLILLACVILLVMAYKPIGTRREFLRLDDEGLTYGNLYGAKHWPWRDLSAFALRGRPGKNAHVTFAVPGKPGWTVNQLGAKAMIEDIYDTPLEDIAAKLNEYRDRALAASGAGAAG